MAEHPDHLTTAQLAHHEKSGNTCKPLAVDAAGAARLCGLSRSQWFKLHSAGRVPLPVRMSPRCPRWLVSEIQDWLETGCPNRQAWLAMKAVRR